MIKIRGQITFNFIEILFLIVCCIVLLNLNGVTVMITGINQVWSPALLLGSISIVLLTLKYGNYTQTLLSIYLFFYGAFIVIGLITTIYLPSYYDTPYPSLVTGHIASIIISYTSYRYVIYKGLKKSEGKILILIGVLISLANFFTTFGHFIGFYDIYNQDVAEHSLNLESRKIGLFANPNEAGFAGNLGILIGLSWLYMKRIPTVIALLVIILGFSSAIFTFSKSAMLTGVALILLYILFGWVNVFKIRRKSRILIAFMVLILSSTSLYIHTNFDNIYRELTWTQQIRVQALQGLLEGRFDTETTSNRSDIFEYGISKILKHPILGNGMGSFLHFPEHNNQALGIHNTYLFIWGEGGIIPMILFIVLLFLMITAYFKKTHTQYKFFILGFTFVYMLYSFASHNVIDDRSVNLILGICFGLLKLYSIDKHKIKCTSNRVIVDKHNV